MIRPILLFLTSALCADTSIVSAATRYSPSDSLRIETILAKAALLNDTVNRVLFIGREFIGTPYVAKTLDKDSTENLVVNTTQLDCTTFVETVTALTLCSSRGERTFAEYCSQLRKLRYRQGNISYPDRLHYFTSWIEDNEQMGFISKVESEKAPFTAVQHLDIYFMSTHVSLYPMLVKNKEMVSDIRQTEKELTGRSYRYIPRAAIKNTQLLRRTIHDGDIIAILTNKRGLDTSHIGIAIWHKDGLHLMNASQIYKKVVEDPVLFSTYTRKHPSQIGIRLCRIIY